MPFSFGVVSLFPDMFGALTEHGVVGRAFRSELCRVDFANPRDFTSDTHRTVDDLPYGGGPGMVMKPEPLSQAIHFFKAKPVYQKAPVICLSPQGIPVSQSQIRDWAKLESIVLVAGRYEGVDERVLQTSVDLEVAVGDLVVSGGELPAMMLMDAIARLRTGVLGDERSAQQDSFSDGRLDWPHYTRPDVFQGLKVPQVLKSGNHQLIANWRLAKALEKTMACRPDLIAQKPVTDQEQKALEVLLKTSSRVD